MLTVFLVGRSSLAGRHDADVTQTRALTITAGA
jgi:hypothetical protein